MLPTVFMKSFDQQKVERTLSSPARPEATRQLIVGVDLELPAREERESHARAA